MVAGGLEVNVPLCGRRRANSPMGYAALASALAAAAPRLGRINRTPSLGRIDRTPRLGPKSPHRPGKRLPRVGVTLPRIVGSNGPGNTLGRGFVCKHKHPSCLRKRKSTITQAAAVGSLRPSSRISEVYSRFRSFSITSPTSWPGLSRPSTSFFAAARWKARRGCPRQARA